MARSMMVAILGAAASSARASTDAVGLVQKSIAVTGALTNETSNTKAASELLIKMSGLVHMIDHDLTAELTETTMLERLFQCTKSSGLDTADSVMQVTKDIVEVRTVCSNPTREAQQRRACAKEVTGFMGDVLGLFVIVPKLPTTCFMQDCSVNKVEPQHLNFNVKANQAIAMAEGMETMLQAMSSIGDVDSTCISRETRTLAALNDANLKYPSWMAWVIKPFKLMSDAYDVTSLAVSKQSEDYHYGICASVAGFTATSLDLMRSLFDVKASQEYSTLGDASDSSSWGCAAALAKMINTLPAVIRISCDYESCKDGEKISTALSMREVN